MTSFRLTAFLGFDFISEIIVSFQGVNESFNYWSKKKDTLMLVTDILLYFFVGNLKFRIRPIIFLDLIFLKY